VTPQRKKIQNFATKGFTGTRIHVFLPSYTEIGKVEVAKWVCTIRHKKVGILPFSVSSEVILPKFYK